jgi:hypothetical protein
MMKKFRQMSKNTKKSPRRDLMKLKHAATASPQRKGKDVRREDLDGRYGKIGIPAVAAALPYQSDAKNPAYAPVAPRIEERHLELAAV